MVAALVVAASATPGCGPTARDASTLPDAFVACAREWRASGLPAQRLDQIEAAHDPVFVDPVSPSCPPGACTDVATVDGCDTLIWARIGLDAYVSYELQGGP